MDPLSLPLHVGHDAAPALTTRLAVGLVAGFLATLVMNVPMRRLREGQTPPFVAGRALSGEPLREVSGGLATGLHYVAGTLGGLLFVLAGAGFERVLPAEPVLTGLGLPVYPYLAALATTALAAFGLVAYALLPAFGDAARDRAATVRRDWGVAVLVYGVTLGFAVPAVLVLFV